MDVEGEVFVDFSVELSLNLFGELCVELSECVKI